MTYDRGSEMACHPELARRLKIDIWFCDPHAPWQRGSNENTNGLLRQFMPKGTDLGDASQTWLNDVAALMNNRPERHWAGEPPQKPWPTKSRPSNQPLPAEMKPSYNSAPWLLSSHVLP